MAAQFGAFDDAMARARATGFEARQSHAGRDPADRVVERQCEPVVQVGPALRILPAHARMDHLAEQVAKGRRPRTVGALCEVEPFERHRGVDVHVGRPTGVVHVPPFGLAQRLERLDDVVVDACRLGVAGIHVGMESAGEPLVRALDLVA